MALSFGGGRDTVGPMATAKSTTEPGIALRILRPIYSVLYLATALLFALAAAVLIAFAGMELWTACSPFVTVETRQRFDGVLESIGLITIAVASLELSQTVLEEEVYRQASMSAPTRVRRFLSRFLVVVVVVSLSIELLVAVFQLVHGDPTRLPHAAAIGLAAAAILASWGLFIRMNRDAEELEPEAMAEAKGEDHKLAET